VVEPILELTEVTKRFEHTVAADRLSLTVYQGEFFTFLGPSGSGKSTILRMIAGLEQPDAGRIRIAGRDVDDVPPWRRNLGMVFQQYAIFPHMTVAQNVAYGLRVRRRPSSEIALKVAAVIQLVGLEGMADRDVTRLSGGEQQRVALARALVLEPSLLLLDEPLSALDEKIRRGMQAELKHIQQKTGTTFLYVTHDQEEALTMSDRIAVLDRGACVQCDAPERLFRRPRTRFVAGFFRGCNIVAAAVLGQDAGRVRLSIGGQPLTVALEDVPPPDTPRMDVAIRAEHLRLGAGAEGCETRIPAILVETIYRGTNVDHVLEWPDGQRVVATSTRREAAAGGAQVTCGLDAADVIPLAG